MIKENSTVSILYTARDIDGRLIDATPQGEPFTCKLGEGYLPEDIEKNLIGLSIGDKKKVILPPEKAFGNYLDENILSIPKHHIPDENNEIQKGKYIELKDATGNVYRGVVQDVTAEHFVIDFNHPLAGKTIEYDLEIVNIS
ncbi:MAG: FKBP-type peptidyl-prolyl cis-trans isomerase [Deferribacterales bacterium]